MQRKQHTSGSLAELLQATLEGPAELPCTGVAAIEEGQQGDITFMLNAKYAKKWAASLATTGIVQHGVNIEGHDAQTRALLRVDNPQVAIAQCLELFSKMRNLPNVGVSERATIDPSATLGEGVRIGPGVVICAKAKLGDHTALLPNVYVASGCTIGSHSELRCGVSVEQDCKIGNNCILNTNVSIGTDGFGYCPSADMSHLIKFQHLGNVELGNDIEIGANSCIDRGKFAATIIGDGTKIDNLVQIGHNVRIGKNCVIAAGTGIAGSVHIGDWVQIGAQVGIAPHCKVGNGAKIGAKSGVMHDIPDGEQWLGVPACKMKDMLRQWVTTRKMPEILAQFSKRT